MNKTELNLIETMMHQTPFQLSDRINPTLYKDHLLQTASKQDDDI